MNLAAVGELGADRTRGLPGDRERENNILKQNKPLTKSVENKSFINVYAVYIFFLDKQFI